MPEEQIVTRSWFSWFVMSFQPLFSPPTRFSTGTRTSSKKTWLMSWSESRSSGSTRMPGLFMSTISIEIPACFAALGSVRTASQQ
jgi:hypothetical protein